MVKSGFLRAKDGLLTIAGFFRYCAFKIQYSVLIFEASNLAGRKSSLQMRRKLLPIALK